MRVDTLIVGGGVMGASIALHRARACDPLEAPVLLLERRELAAGSSGRSGAILRQFYSDRQLVEMARDSLGAYASFELRTARALGFTRSGVLTIAGAGQAGSRELLERNIALMRSCGIEVERVLADDMRRLVPGLAVDDAAIGAWERDAGFVDPGRTVHAFVEAARANGATARCGVEVTGFHVENRRVRAVETSDGRVECERVVVAAGPWTRALLARAGIDLPLRVVRPEQHFLAMPPARGVSVPPAPVAPEAEFDRRFSSPSEPAPAHPVLLDLELGFYTRCEPGRARTRVGALDYARDAELPEPDALDERVSDEFASWSRAQLVERLPRYGEQEELTPQAAWYTLTPDAQALIGPCPGLDNALVVAGFSGHGFKLAPSVGEGVAQMLAGEPVTAFDAAFFSPARFASGAQASWGGAFGL